MGLMYIGAMLKKSGHEPKIHDCFRDNRDLHLLKQVITEWKPDFIGISIIVTELEQTGRIMKMIREIMPDIPVIFGGPWPSANPEDSIKEFGADFVILGEGEMVFPQLIEAISNCRPTEYILGTASLVNSHVKINPGRHLTEDELNVLPFPAWDLLDEKLYKKNPSFAGVGSRPYMSILTSRGCPFNCIYCHQTMGKIFRKRSAESVLAEMEELYFKHGVKEFEIIDDCFNLDRERMSAILEGIRDRLGDVKLHFPNAVRADMLEPEDMILFKQAGTVSAVFAIETSSPRLQKMIRKNLNLDKVIPIINSATKAGIYSTGYFMIGFPSESYEEASDTVEFAVRSSLHRAVFFNPTPFPGTELANMAAEIIKIRNYPSNLRNMNYFAHKLNISAMTDCDLQKIFRVAHRRFYMNPKRLWRIALYHPRVFSLLWYTIVVLIKIQRRRSSCN